MVEGRPSFAPPCYTGAIHSHARFEGICSRDEAAARCSPTVEYIRSLIMKVTQCAFSASCVGAGGPS